MRWISFLQATRFKEARTLIRTGTAKATIVVPLDSCCRTSREDLICCSFHILQSVLLAYPPALEESVAETRRKIGDPGGLEWTLAGALGALMGVGDDALLLTLKEFAVSLGFTEEFAGARAAEWLPQYRAQLKKGGVANA